MVYLDEEEIERYRDISYKASKECHKDKQGNVKITEKGKMLLLQRARIVAGAKSKLDEASEKISEAEAEIEKIQTPEWYISDRRGTVSFNSYLENSNKINAIARVFPVFFFLKTAVFLYII